MGDTSDSSRAKRTDPILEDHRNLAGILDKIESTGELAQLIAALEGMYSLLEGHFAAEEAPKGMYDVIRQNAPHHLPHVQRLVEDHRAFLKEIDAVRESAQACLEGPVMNVLRSASDLAARLRIHETQETEMFMDAMYTDLGETD